MAGEIQIDSVTALTASGSNIVLNNVNTATNRTNLGLGSIATQSANSVSISGGNITGGTIGSGVTFPAGNVISGQIGGGHILQFQQKIKTDFFSNTSKYSSWVDVTGLSVSITPSSLSNKILVVVHLTGSANTNGMWIIGQVLRNSTAIGIGDSRGISARAGFGWKHAQAAADSNSGIETGSTMLLDAPNTTSLITYKVQACNGNTTVNGTWTINGTYNSSASYNSSSVSSITVMEIAA
jgi:hypothetical protein